MLWPSTPTTMADMLCRIRPKFCLVAILSFPLPHLFATMFVFFLCSFSSLFSFFSSRKFSFSTCFYAGVTAPLAGLACTLQRFTLYGFALAKALLDKAPRFRKPFSKQQETDCFHLVWTRPPSALSKSSWLNAF